MFAPIYFQIFQLALWRGLFANLYAAWPLPSSWCREDSPIAARGYPLPAKGEPLRVAAPQLNVVPTESALSPDGLWMSVVNAKTC
jgi:hypothetical protein